MDAETAYIFRHALLSSAAYDLQPPGDRARLHRIALQILEQTEGSQQDAAALELAHHAQFAQADRRTVNLADLKLLAQKECGYLYSASRHAFANFDFSGAKQVGARLAMHPAATLQQQVMAWMTLGEVERLRGRQAPAKELYAKAAQLAEHPGLERERAKALRGVAICLRRTPEAATGIDLMRQALALITGTGDEAAALMCRADLAVLEGDRGDAAGAIAIFEGVAHRQRELGASELLAVTLLTLSEALLRAGRLDEADRAIDEAESIAKATANLLRQAGVALTRANLRRAQGRQVEAAQEAERSLALRRKLGDESMRASGLSFSAMLAAEAGNFPQAVQISHQVLALCEESGDPYWHAVARMNLGVWLEKLGQIAEAEQASRSAARDLEKLGDMRTAAIARGNLANALKAQGKLDQALECYRRAVPDLERMGLAVPLGVHLGGMAEALARTGVRAEAESCYQRSCQMLSAAGAGPQLEDIKRRWQAATGGGQQGGESVMS